MKSGMQTTRAYGHTGLEELDCLCGSRAKGDANCLDSNIEECMDYSDSQLETIILSGGLCDGLGDELFTLMNDLRDEQDFAPTNLNVENIDDSMVKNAQDTHIHIQTSDHGLSMPTPASPSSLSEYSRTSSPSTVTGPITSAHNITPKSKKKRPKRIHDDRVKLQNKMAAIKYRNRKKQEQEEIDHDIRIEEEKNKKLKASVKELKVQIKVIKDFVNKLMEGKK